MENEYLVLQCGACERSVKIKSNASGTHFGCPYCKSPVEIPGSDPVEQAPADLEPERPPLDFRRIEETESVEAGASPQHTGSTETAANKGERRRHRRRAESLDWDESPDSRSHKSADHGYEDDDSSEFLEMDPDSPGGVRLKRVRRRKVTTTKEKIFRIAVVGTVVALVGVMATVFIKGVFKTAGAVVQDGQSQEDVSAQVFKDMAAAKAAEELKKKKISPVLSSAEEEGALEIINGFLDSDKIEDKLKFVRDPEQVEPLMRDWYARNPIQSKKPDGVVLRRDKQMDKGRYFIRLYIEFAGDTNLLDKEFKIDPTSATRRMFMVEQTEDEMKLDWETAVEYQPLTLADFKDKRPTEAVEFRVKVKPSDFYNFGFDEDQHIATELSYPGKKEFKLIGYLKKTSADAKKITEYFENGVSPSLIVKLRYPDRKINDDSLVEIVSITSDTWLR